MTELTPAQAGIKTRRMSFELKKINARIMREEAELGLKALCLECKHDSTKSWEQSASGNESWYVCDLCGAEVD